MNPAQLILPALRARNERFDHLHSEIVAALKFGVGGFILFGGTAESAAEIIRWTRIRSELPLLFGADLERGAGQQFRGLSHLPPLAALAELGDQAIRNAAVLTAREATEVGINWIFAPVADLDLLPNNPIVQSRSFGGDSQQVARQVSLWVEACQGQGIPATVKHFPGHGRTLLDSHSALPIVSVPTEILAHDLAPFQAAIQSGVAAVMTAHVAYPALDRSGLPATRSPAIINYLRQSLGFDGPVVTDAMTMGGATSGISETEAAISIVDAGVDLLLYPRNPQAVAQALLQGAEDPVRQGRLLAAIQRRASLLELSAGTGPAGSAAAREVAQDLATELVSRPPVRGVLPHLHHPLSLTVIDDDLDGDWPVSTSANICRDHLLQHGVPLGPGGSRVLLLFSEPRAGKGRGGLGENALHQIHQQQNCDLVLLFGHQRLAASIPGEAPIVVAWHRQPLLQQAAARLLERLSR